MKAKYLFIGLEVASIGGIQRFCSAIFKLERSDLLTVVAFEENNNFFSKLLALCALIRKMVVHRFNSISTVCLLHVRLSTLVFPVLFLSRRVIIVLYGIECWKPLKLLKVCSKFGLSVEFVAISDFTAREFIKFNPWASELISNIRLRPILDADFASVARVKLDRNKKMLSPHNTDLITVSRLDEKDSYKGVDFVIKSLPLLIESGWTGTYQVVGKGNDLERLRCLTIEVGVKHRVQFHGAIDSLADYLAEICAVYAMPSTGEGFGIAYIEALAMGLPCIGMREGPLREIAPGSPSIGLLQEKNPDEFVRLFNRLVNVHNGFSGEDILDRYSEVDMNKSLDLILND